jgi:ferredoxin
VPSHRSTTDTPSVRALRVDRVACTGHGVCAGILPAAVGIDEWGYPVLDGAGPHDATEVAAAIRLCPAMALYLGDGA